MGWFDLVSPFVDGCARAAVGGERKCVHVCNNTMLLSAAAYLLPIQINVKKTMRFLSAPNFVVAGAAKLS